MPIRPRVMSRERAYRDYDAACFLLLCVALGGASAAGALANLALRLVSIGVLVAAITGRFQRPRALHRQPPALLLAAGAALMLIQLVPLPPSVWSLIPGRELVVRGFALAGLPLPWLPISLAPDRTVSALLSLLPPAAMIVLTLDSTATGRRNAGAALVLAALGSAGLGMAQLLLGIDGPLYPYAVTNRGSAVGLFANRNHLATLLLIALPYVAATAASSAASVPRRTALAIAGLVLGGIVLLLRSVAGWALLPPTLIGCAAIVRARRGAYIAIAAAAAAALALLVATGQFHPRLPDGADPQHREVLLSRTLTAAVDYLPFGAGGGSFQQIYPGYENAADATPEFANHAHNDYAETWLEYGLVGLCIAGAGILWWISRLPCWWRDGSSSAKAGFVALGIVILHSSADYPLRTAAIAAIAAFSATLLVDPPPMPSVKASRRYRDRRSSAPGLSALLEQDI